MTSEPVDTAERFCPSCGHGWPPDARFCGDCGHALALPLPPQRASAPVSPPPDPPAPVPAAPPAVPAPPVSEPPPTPPPAAPAAPAKGRTLSPGTLVAGIASIGMLIGCFISWTSDVSLNAFDIPLLALLDPDTTSSQPRLGYVLVIAAGVGIATCFIRHKRLPRIVSGAVALLLTVVFVLRVADEGGGAGAGAFLTGIASIALIVSAFLREPDTKAR